MQRDQNKRIQSRVKIEGSWKNFPKDYSVVLSLSLPYQSLIHECASMCARTYRRGWILEDAIKQSENPNGMSHS